MNSSNDHVSGRIGETKEEDELIRAERGQAHLSNPETIQMSCDSLFESLSAWCLGSRVGISGLGRWACPRLVTTSFNPIETQGRITLLENSCASQRAELIWQWVLIVMLNNK